MRLTQKMNIVIFSSSDYCLSVLESLDKYSRIATIITRPDKPVGRQQIITPSTPKVFAIKHNITVFTPENKQQLLALKEQISLINPDLAIVADYGLIIPKEIFAIPRYKTLNVHFSKLPKFRGPTPVQYTILYGDKSAWITIFVIDEGTDTGDIIWQKEIPLIGSETTESLYKKLFNVTATELPNVISLYVQNKLKPKKQDDSKATYTKLLTRDNGFISPQLLKTVIKGITPTAKQLKQWSLVNLIPQLTINNYQLAIERTIRAFTPWPGVWTEVQITDNKKQITKRLKILKAHLEPATSNLQPPTKLVLDLIQLEGKKPVSFKQFQEGYPNLSF